MVAKGKNASTKSKKPGDLELLQKNWETSLELELDELERLEKDQEKKVRKFTKEGLSNSDIFKLKKLEELQKSKNHKASLDQELLFFFEQLTGFKPLKQECERLSKRVEDIKLVVQKLREFNKEHFENEKKLLDILHYVRELKAADIEAIKSELSKLDLLWDKWNTLKKEQISKKIKDKQLVLSYTQNKSESEIEKLKVYFKKLKTISRSKKSDEIYRELRLIPEFKTLKATEIKDILSKIDSKLKNSSSKEVEQSLINLQEMEQKTLSEIEEGFLQLKLVPYLMDRSK